MGIARRKLVVWVGAWVVGVGPAAGQDKYVEPDYGAPPEWGELGAGIEAGEIEHFQWRSQEVYEGTVRNVRVYRPAGFVADGSARLAVFQDGHTYVRKDGDFRVPRVLDHLVARGEVPMIVAVFIDPGVFTDELPEEVGWAELREFRSNRSVEYDSPDGRYAEFLEKEILPEVARRAPFSAKPEDRAICGISSGGICAFTAAWERPDLFRRVMSHVGSFVNIRGGYHYPYLLRKEEARPLRVYLQGGGKDLDNEHGNWPLANQQMAAALAFAGYAHRFDYDERGAHGGKYGGSVLPDGLRWLWSDE